MAIDLTTIGVPGSSYDDFNQRTTSTTVELEGVATAGLISEVHKYRSIDPYSALSPSGTPGGRYTFDNQVSDEILGVEATGELGDLTTAVQTVITLDSLVATSALDTITASIPISVTLDGTEGTGAIDTLTVVTSSNIELEAVEGDAQVGAIVTDLTLVTLVATSGIGTLALSTQQILDLTGHEATGLLGTIALSADSVTAVAGNEATGELGTLAVSVPAGLRIDVSDLTVIGTPGALYNFNRVEPIVVFIDGVEATGSTAIFDGLTTTVTPDTQTGTGSVGSVTESTDQVVPVTGVEATGSLGDIDFQTTIELTAVESTGFLGGLSISTPSGTQSELESLLTTAALGTISVQTDQVITPTGVEATGESGNLLIRNVSLELVGVTAYGAVASFAVDARKGGRVRHKGRKRYVVEVDGQLFHASSVAEANAILEQVRELAEEAAQQSTVRPRIRVKTAAGKEITSKPLQNAVIKTQVAVYEAYERKAKGNAIDQEIASLMHAKIAREQRDEEMAIIALLLL